MSKKNRPYPAGSEDWSKRSEFAPEFPPYNNQNSEVYSSGAASATDYTGLTATEPLDGAEADSLRDVADMPVTPKRKKNRTSE